MIYLDTREYKLCNHAIYDDLNLDEGVNKYDDYTFECDELIAPVISTLNQKGYKTRYCCQGHLATYFIIDSVEGYSIEKDDYALDSYPYIMFEDSYPEIKYNIPNDWILTYTPKDWRITAQRQNEGKKIELFRKIPGVECAQILRMSRGTIGEFLNKNNIIRNNETMNSDFMKYNVWTAIMMSKLLEWAEGLPVRSK